VIIIDKILIITFSGRIFLIKKILIFICINIDFFTFVQHGVYVKCRHIKIEFIKNIKIKFSMRIEYRFYI